ncbi:MAG: sulfite exporter TauE/SafE family protein [Deltaproteobacteria bacterium]
MIPAYAMQFMIVFSVAFLASLLSSMSGAGSAILTTPVWLSLGFPLPVAIASNQMNGAAWTLIAARNYLKGRILDRALIRNMVCFGLAGAYVGTVIVRSVDVHLLQRVIGCIIVGLVVVVGLNPSLGRTESEPCLSRLLTGILAFPLGVYESFFGSGNGLFTSILLSKSRGLSLLTALGYYYVIVFAWNCFAVSIYIVSGLGNIRLMLPSTVGSMLGAYFGSRIGRRKGYGLVRALFLTVGGILGVKLALGW